MWFCCWDFPSVFFCWTLNRSMTSNIGQVFTVQQLRTYTMQTALSSITAVFPILKKYQPYFEVFLPNLVEICSLWNGFREEFTNQVYRRVDRRRTTHDRTTLTWSRFCSNCYLGPLVGSHERLIVQGFWYQRCCINLYHPFF